MSPFASRPPLNDLRRLGGACFALMSFMMDSRSAIRRWLTFSPIEGFWLIHIGMKFYGWASALHTSKSVSGVEKVPDEDCPSLMALNSQTCLVPRKQSKSNHGQQHQSNRRAGSHMLCTPALATFDSGTGLSPIMETKSQIFNFLCSDNGEFKTQKSTNCSAAQPGPGVAAAPGLPKTPGRFHHSQVRNPVT